LTIIVDGMLGFFDVQACASNPKKQIALPLTGGENFL
jgi:hypothetical protein